MYIFKISHTFKQKDTVDIMAMVYVVNKRPAVSLALQRLASVTITWI